MALRDEAHAARIAPPQLQAFLLWPVGGLCCVIAAAVLWRALPRLRANIREIYVRIGVISE